MGVTKSKKITMPVPFKSVAFRQEFVACNNREKYRRQEDNNATDDFGKVRTFEDSDLVEVESAILARQ